MYKVSVFADPKALHLLNEIVEKISENELIAYADDLAIVLTRNNSKAVEQKAITVTIIPTKWCHKQKLQLSKTKSQMILLKD